MLDRARAAETNPPVWILGAVGLTLERICGSAGLKLHTLGGPAVLAMGFAALKSQQHLLAPSLFK